MHRARLLLSLAVGLAAAWPGSLWAQRQSLDLGGEWRFLRQDTTPSAPVEAWEKVTVPHTWNLEDGAVGKAAHPELPEGYYRGPAWYERALDLPPGWKGKRVFIRFEGVSLVADVLVNGIAAGQHRGGFAAFCYEITPYLRFDGHDALRVRVDNARAYDVAPLSGDFTVFGGIYRPVRLIATGEACISPVDFGSAGVFLTVKDLGADQATVETRAVLSSRVVAPAEVQVEIRDAAGALVAQTSRPAALAVSDSNTVTERVELRHPHLWEGRADPYLYTATVRLLMSGSAVDEVTQPLGIRTVAVTNDRGFLLNGHPYALHGVDYHQDHGSEGWAVSDADQDEDHAMIDELGATTVRLVHYQHAQHFHDLSDRTGLIEWQEVPLVDTVAGTPQFLANARQQLAEMILQSYNHPSTAMWGLFNELDASWAAVHSAVSVPVVRSLQDLARELDPARPTVAATWGQPPGPRHRIPDWCCWNIYPGWYNGNAEDAAGLVGNYSRQLGKRIGISEYGAGANPAQYAEGALQHPKPAGPFHPQEWQNYVHEQLWAQLKDNPHIWGTWLWVMFDLASDGRNEGSQPGVNDKGLVTRDRKVRKDTFYFYKANWNPAPMVYIASRRATPRRQAVTGVEVFSNCAQVELKVNGASMDQAAPDGIHVCRWPRVRLQPGANHIEAIGEPAGGGASITDSCDWTLEEAP